MARLPDIPVESWAADQVDLFQKQVKNYFPALEFEAATNDQQSDISPDWPYPGGQDNWEQAAQQAADDERRKQEEQLRAQQEAQVEAEAAQHQSMLSRAWDAATSMGIPSPDQAFSAFQNAVGTPPGTGDNSSTTGAFEQGTPVMGGLQTPQDVGAYPPEPPSSGVIDTRNAPVNDNETLASTTPLQDLSPSPPPTGETIRPMTAAEQRGFAVRNAPSAIFNGVADLATRAGQGIYDEAQALPGQAADVGRGIGQLALGDNALTELGAGAQGVGTLGRYAYDAGGAYAQAAGSKAYEEATAPPLTEVPRVDDLSSALTAGDKLARTNPMYRGIQDTQGILQAGGEAAGRQVALDYGFTDAPVTKNPLTGEPISALDIAGLVGQMGLDPTNYVGGGEGVRAARAVETGAEDAISPAGRLAAEQLRLGARDDPAGIGGGLLAANRAPSAVFDFGRDVVGRTAGLGSDLAQELGSGARSAVEDIPHIRDVADTVLGAGRDADLALGRGADVLGAAAGTVARPISEGIRQLGRYTYENPDKAAGLVGGALSEATAPEDLTPEERLQRDLVGGGALALGIRARKLPFAEAGAEGARRMYHGAGTGWGLIDALHFNPNGLYGPAHYLTSDARVAGSYAEARQSDALDHLSYLNDSIKELQDNLQEPNLTKNDRANVENMLRMQQEELDQYSGQIDSGANIRPANLDDRAYLFHADKIVPPSDFERIGKAAMRLYGDDPEAYSLAQEYVVAAQQGEKSSGNAIYEALAADFGPRDAAAFDPDTGEYIGSKEVANKILSEAGFDGIYYKGGQRMGIVDENNKIIEHDAVAIFPDKLDAITNAFSGEKRAVKPALSDVAEYPRAGYFQDTEPGKEFQQTIENTYLPQNAEAAGRVAGSLVGGTSGGLTGAAQGDENTTWQDRLKNAAAGFTVGAVFGHQVGGYAGYQGTVQLAKQVDSMIRRGVFDTEVLSTHPGVANRIKAMLGLAAEGVPDDQIVQVPGLVSDFFRGLPDSELDKLIPQDTKEFPFDPDVLLGVYDSDITAGQIRAWLRGTTTPSGWKQALGDLLTDKLSEQDWSLSQMRGMERRADVTSVTGRLPEHLQGIQDTRPRYLGDTPFQYGNVWLRPMKDFAEQYPKDAYPFLNAVQRVSDQLGVETPTVMVVGNASNNAAMYPVRNYAPILGVNSGLLRSDLSMNELEATIRHELTHGVEVTADNTGLPAILNKLPEGLNIPRRGLWKDRLETGLQIPENASEEEKAQITEAFNNSMQHLLTAQNTNKAVLRIRNTNRAKDFWNEYESLRDRATGEPGTVEPSTALTPTARPEAVSEPTTPELPQPPADVAGTPLDEAPFGETAPTPDVTPAEGDLSFAEEPLPESLDPTRRFDPEEAGKMIGQLRDSLAAQPTDRSWMETQANKLLANPKALTGKNLQTLLEGVGLRRALGRTGSKAEEATQYAQKFLQDNGWIAPAAEAAAETPGATTALSSLAPVPGRSTDTLGRAADVLGRGVQMATTGGIGAVANEEMNPDDPNAALKGFAAGALLPAVATGLVGRGLRAAGKEIPSEVGTLGVFGPSNTKVARGLDGNVRLNADPSYQQFVNPAQPSPLIDKKLSEKVHDYWREKWVTGVTDQYGVLEGLMRDLARVYHDQTGKAMPVEAMAASVKRLNSDRAVEMDIQDKFQPHLQTFHELGVSNARVDAYLLNKQNIDIALDQGKNLSRNFPGSQTYANSIVWNNEFERQLQKDMTPAEYRRFQDAIQGVHDFGDHVLKYLVAGDLISPAAYNDLRQRFPHYVPTRLTKYLNDSSFIGKGKSLSVNSNTLRELTTRGSSDEAMSPLAALYGQAYSAHAAAQKNTVANRLVDMWALAGGNTGMSTAVGFNPPVLGAPGLSNMERRVAKFAGGIQPVAAGQKVTNEENVLNFFRQGIPTRMEVTKELGDIVKYPSPAHVPVISGMMAAFRAGATSRNPAFITANAFLDLSNVMAREVARAGGPTIPNIAKVFGAWGSAMIEYVASPQAWKDMYTGTYRGDMAGALREGGGMSGGHFAGGGLRPKSFGTLAGVDLQGMRESLGYGNASELEQGIKDLQNGHEVHSVADLVGKLKDAALFKWAETIGERIELAGRIPGYRLEHARGAARHAALMDELAPSQAAHQAMQAVGTPFPAGMRSPEAIQADIAQNRGLTSLKAVNNFRDTTLDFDKGGNITKAINQWIPFFNVGVQSLADVGRALSENPKGYAATAALGIVGPMTAAEAWNQGDEQRRQDYADIPDYIKDQGMVVMLPEHVRNLVPEGYQDHFTPEELNTPLFPARTDQQGNRQPQFFHFRFRQLAPLAMGTRYMLQNTIYQNDDNPIERRWKSEILLSAFDQLSPLSAQNPPDMFANLMPPPISTGVQLAFDRDTFHGNRRINTTYGSERAAPLSHGVSDAASSVLGRWATPARAEFFMRDLGSGFAGAYLGASQIPGQLRGDTPINEQNLPVVGGLYNRFVKNSIGGIAQNAEANPYTPDADRILTENGITDWRPAHADPAIRNVPLTRSEYGAYQQDLNQVTDEVIHDLAADTGWQSLPPADKKYVLQTVLGRYHAMVEAEHLGNIPGDEIDSRLQREIDAGHLTTAGRR